MFSFFDLIMADKEDRTGEPNMVPKKKKKRQPIQVRKANARKRDNSMKFSSKGRKWYTDDRIPMAIKLRSPQNIPQNTPQDWSLECYRILNQSEKFVAI